MMILNSNHIDIGKFAESIVRNNSKILVDHLIDELIAASERPLLGKGNRVESKDETGNP